MGIIMTTKELRPRQKNDFYPTPYELVRAGLEKIEYEIPYPRNVLDPGAGNGVWGREVRRLWSAAPIMGIEIDPTFAKPSVYEWWNVVDYLDKDVSGVTFDLIVGNPPYRQAERFIRKSFELLEPKGHIFFLLRLAMLESQRRAKGLWQEHRPKKVYVLGRRPSFTGNGKTDATAYALYLWQKGWQGETTLDWLMWDYDDEREEPPTLRREMP